MSNALAMAAVTATLRNLILSAPNLPSGTHVTALSPQEANDSTLGNQINLFLYHVLPNAAWRNRDLPGHLKPGETGLTPLSLNLHYLLTAYHRESADLVEITSQSLLGGAMSVLYDHPILGPDEIKQALPDNDLYLQPERVRITWQPLSLEEMSKLWMMFQTRYRISAAYEVSVVLIESNRPTKTPLPVLTIGKDNRGIVSRPDLLPAIPTLLTLQLSQRPSALLGDDLILSGHDLRPDDAKIDNTKTAVRFTNPSWQDPVERLPKVAATSTQVTVTLPTPTTSKSVQWPAGFYTVAIVFKDANKGVVRVTNGLSFSLAPRILSKPAIKAVRDPSSKDVTITLSCSPAIVSGQRVSLLLRDREIQANPITPPQNMLTFQAGNIAAGDYPLRLRVDGVDSYLITWQNGTLPTFDSTQKVRVPA